MSNSPATPSSSGRSSNALGRFLNKLRTPTGTDSTVNQHDDQPSRPSSRASSPFGSLIGRRSTSRASVRTFDSQASGMPAPPPFPASLNNSSLSLASSSRYPSLDTHDDADVSFPEFETNPFGLSPSSTSLASSHAGGQLYHGATDSAGDATLQARPAAIARPGTSMSTRSRAESTADDAASSRGYATSTSATAQKESLGLSSRPFGKSLLGKRKEATDAVDAAAAGGEGKAAPRAPLARSTSDEPARSLATTTPAFPREPLSSSSTASSDPRRMFGVARPAGTTGMRRARRVVQTAQPIPSAAPSAFSDTDGLSTPESQGVLADGERSTSASAGAGSASDNSPLEVQQPLAASRSTREPSPASTAQASAAAPAPRARPPISPNAHGRSRSELPPSSPRMSLPNDRSANTVTISASTASSGLSTSQSYQTSPSEFGAPVAPLFSSRGPQQAGANGSSQQPLGSTAFRNRFLNSSSASSLSSANNSPDMGGNLSSSTSATSNPTPPNAGSALGQGGTVGGGGGFKLAPLGAAGSGLSRKPSISMLSAVAEGQPMPPPASRHAPIDTRQHEPVRIERTAKPAIDLGRASLDERRASPPRESEGMVPYAHRRTASRTVGPGDSSVLSESTTTGSGTHGGTTLVNTTHGGGLKRSNSETVTQGLMGPPAATTIARPPSTVSLYRDEQHQQAAPVRPAVSRVPSGRQALAERPTVAEAHAEPQDGYRHVQPEPQPAQQQQQQAPTFQPYQDENAYSSRAPHGRPDGPLPPPPAPSTSVPPYQQMGTRPVLAEVNRAYPQPQAPSTQQRSTAPLYGMQTAQKAGGEYQVPLRDRSPGLADATPSATVQQAHYQSQQAYQQRHQQQLQQQYQQHPQQHLPPQQGVSFAPEQPATEKKIAKPIIVNGRPYTRCGLLGRGGSSKVYRVISERNDILALKKVDTRNDTESRSSFINEITLLRKLAGKPEIIQLVDSEIQGRHVIMVMEAGETDLHTLLGNYSGKPISLNFIRYIWEQMLSAVQVIHDEAVVHSDLKPANFVLVKGRVKLIDFGISKAIAGDTTNIGREQQIGSANYMPPEALNDTGLGLGGKRLMKLGRAADVWSLGCILYQMVYGRGPFGHLRDIAIKIAAISSPSTRISFPEVAYPLGKHGESIEELKFFVGPDLLATLKSCLIFDPKQRASIPELLDQPFLRRTSGDSAQPDLPYISRGIMDAVIRRVSDKVRGPRNPLSELDLMDIAQELMSEVWSVQDTLRR